MSVELSSQKAQELLYQVLGKCEVECILIVGQPKELNLREDVGAVQLSDEAYRKLCEGTYVCCDFLPCRVDEGQISEVALAVRGDTKSVIPYTAWFLGGRNKQISEPFAELTDSLADIIDKKGQEVEKMLSLEDPYDRGFIEVIEREAGDLCDKVQILPLGVALTRFYDPHQIGLSTYPRKPVLRSVESYGHLLSVAADASGIRIRRYPYKRRLSSKKCPQVTKHSIGAVRSTIQPVAALLLPAQVYDTWIENKTANSGEGISELIRVSRKEWQNDVAIEFDGRHFQPLAFIQDVIDEVFRWNQ
jgi:hypothetical protein